MTRPAPAPTPAAFAKRFGEPQPYMRPRRRRGEVRTCPASRDTAVPTGRSGLSPIVWLDPKTLPLAPHASHRKGSRRFLALSGVIGSNVLSAVECRPSVWPFTASSLPVSSFTRASQPPACCSLLRPPAFAEPTAGRLLTQVSSKTRRSVCTKAGFPQSLTVSQLPSSSTLLRLLRNRNSCRRN